MAAGYDPEQFWNSTFKEVELHMRAAKRVVENRHNALMISAHAVACLSRADKIPPLDELLVGEDAARVRKKNDAQDHDAAWRSFALANGITPAEWDAAVAAAERAGAQ